MNTKRDYEASVEQHLEERMVRDNLVQQFKIVNEIEKAKWHQHSNHSKLQVLEDINIITLKIHSMRALD